MEKQAIKWRMRPLFNGFLMGLGFGFIMLGGQGLFLMGAAIVLVGGTLERIQQRRSTA